MHRYALAIGLASIACISGCNPRSGDRTVGNDAAGSNEAVASVDVTNGVDAQVERSPYQISAFTILPRVIPAGMRSPVRVQATIVLHEDLIKPAVTLEQLSPDGVRLSDLGNLVVVEWPGHDVGTARDFRLTPNVFPETKGTTSFRLRLESDGIVEYSGVVNVRTGTPSWEDHSDFVVAFQEQLIESYRKQLETSDHASAAEAVLAEARADKRVRRATLGPGGMDLSIDYAFGVGGTVTLVQPPLN